MKAVQPKYGVCMTICACLWLGLFPLLQGGTYATLTRDKWVIMLILTGLTLLCFITDLMIRRRVILNEVKDLPPRSFLPLVFATALFLWTVLSCLCSSYGPKTWWRGETARYEGLLSQLCYFVLFACFFFSRVNLKPVLLSAAAGIAVFFVIVLLQRGGGNPLGLYPTGRSYALNPEFQGTIGNIDMGTGYLLLLAGLFLYGIIDSIHSHIILKHKAESPALSSRPKRRDLLTKVLYFSFLSIALLLTLYLILTMDVQFGVISLAVLFFVTLLRFIPKKLRLPLLILVIVLALLVVWFWPGQSGGVWELHEIFHGRGRLSFGSNRVAVWLYSLRLSGESPFLGGGSGTFVSRFNHYLADNGLVIPKEQGGLALPDYFDTPHNEYIAQLTDHGLPALFLFLALLLVAIFRRRDRGLPLLTPCSAAVLCYAVQAFFSFSVCIVAPMFWVVLALAAQDNS